MQTDCSPHATPRRRVRRPALFAFAVLAPLMTSGLLRAQLPNPAAYLTFDEGKGTVAHDSSGRNETLPCSGRPAGPPVLLVLLPSACPVSQPVMPRSPVMSSTPPRATRWPPG